MVRLVRGMLRRRVRLEANCVAADAEKLHVNATKRQTMNAPYSLVCNLWLIPLLIQSRRRDFGSIPLRLQP